MIKNYLAIAIRTFWKHRMFSFINISGLATGIGAALVIFMIVSYDFSFEKKEKDGDRIYRVVSTMQFPGQIFPNSGVPVPMIATAKRELTGIDKAAPFFLYQPKVTVQSAGHEVYKQQTHVIIADENYFSLFHYDWIIGGPRVMSDPFKVVLTESRARTYFHDQDFAAMIGKTITYNDSLNLTVAGIVRDRQVTSDLTFVEFVSYATTSNPGLQKQLNFEEWGSVGSSTQLFLKLSPGTRVDQIEKQLKNAYAVHAKDNYLSITYALQSLYDVHFNAQFDNFDQRIAHKPTLYGLLTLAAFLLLLGCINFINLTTAQGAQRAKEIGIRKTMGSSRGQLVFQFLTETFILTVVATLLSLFLIPGILAIFSSYIPAEVNTGMLKQLSVISFIAALVLIITILSGLYPAIFLSAYSPSLVLKKQSNKGGKASLRQTLTVSQFAIAQFFIIAAFIVVKQIGFMLHKDLGFKTNAIITFNIPSSFKSGESKKTTLFQTLSSMPGVATVSLAGGTPAQEGMNFTTMKFFNGKKVIESTVEEKNADTSYFRVFDMKLLAGRFLQASDTNREYVINNAYAKFLGYNNPGDIVGKTIERGDAKIPIVGVLVDFHAHSLHSQIMPLAFTPASKNSYAFHIALANTMEPGKWKTTIADIENSFKAAYPGETFSYEFFDDRIAKFYASEQRISKLLVWATSLAIFISCLGLLGLVIYTTGVRTKEIGIRKVVGASVRQIVELLSKDFLRLVILAIIIAAPISGWVMSHWLQGFAYRTKINWWIFFVTGAVLIIIALLTLSIQTLRAATANPVKSLRTE